MCRTIFYATTFLFLLSPMLHSQNAAFTMDVSSGCGPLCVNFSDQSTNPVSWYWDFGDGNYSTFQYPNHCYITPGAYQVTLTVTFASSTGTATGTVNVYPNPVADFTSSSTGGNAFTFTDQSTGASTWMWSFGDTTFSTQQNPMHMYNYPGVDTVCLLVTSTNGCVDTTCHQETVVIIGMDEYGRDQSFSIFPVPASGGRFTVEFDAHLANEVPVIITNALGEIVRNERINGTTFFDLSAEATGIYFIRVGNAAPRKLIIQ